MIQCLTMTSLKTKNICFLAAFLFLTIVPTLARVVNEVKDCKQFLYQGIPPEIPGVLVGGNIQDQNTYKVICQTYKDEPRFLTVYDTKNKIPVFSAYEYKGSMGDRSGITWKIEPQLENLQEVNMRPKGRTTCNNQAVNADYKEQNMYDKGHLFPANHASHQDELDSTFTLTNAVPQVDSFNRGRWSQMEYCMKCIVDYFINAHQMKCFVVVGAIPGNTNLNNRVNIPKVMWSAFYCTNGDSGAYWDFNVKRDPAVPMTRFTLKQLKLALGINPFP